MKATIFSNTDIIGVADLKVTDTSMGVLSGTFLPSESYKKVRNVIWNFNEVENEKKDFESIKNLRLNVQLENGYFILSIGGISIWDVKELKDEPIQIDVAGVFRHVIEDYFSNSSNNEAQLKKPWDFLSIEQKLSFENELNKEIGEKSSKGLLSSLFGSKKGDEHKLFDTEYCAIANTELNDDVLFAVHKPGIDYSFAIVHLTWKGKKELVPDWPLTKYYDDFHDFRTERMIRDHEEWTE